MVDATSILIVATAFMLGLGHSLDPRSRRRGVHSSLQLQEPTQIRRFGSAWGGRTFNNTTISRATPLGS